MKRVEAEAPEKLPVTCAATGKTALAKPLKDGSPGLPKGWHKMRSPAGGWLWYSPEGWASLYAMRAARLPVASVIEGYAQAIPGEWSVEACTAGWKAFREALRASSRQCVQYANLVLAELFAADRLPLVKTAEGKDRLPLLPAVELYQLGRGRFPELDSQSLGSVKQKAQAKYKEQRWDLRVTGREGLSSFRDGMPVPIPAKDARIEISHRHQEDVPEQKRKEGSGQPFLFVRLAGRRFTLRLRSGGAGRKHYSFGRHIAALEKIAAGQALQGEVTLHERRAPDAGAGNGLSARAAPGAPKYRTRVFATISCWLPRELGERQDVDIRVQTAAERLWNVWIGSQQAEPWLLNEDQARGWVIAHRRRLQRLSEDAKFERRARLRGQPIKPADLAGVRARISAAYKKRLDDWAHKATNMLANFAKRQKACRVLYNDSEKSFAAGLPWFKLRTLLADKLSRFGIEFVQETTSGDTDGE